MNRSFLRPLLACLIFAALARGGTPVLAGTTGGLSGIVQNASTRAPLAGAKISAVSASQSATTTSDASGHFIFASLAPDTYTVSVEKPGFDSASIAGVSVFADQTQSLALRTQPQLRTIGRVTSRSNSDLIKPGVTTDVYSVSAAQQTAASALGGGGSLNQAYSAVASQPGVYVPQGQNGIYQSVYIRGGNYTNIGYEFDGVPIQRAFDQYASNTLSSLGQQEVQVYTGANPIGSQTNGLAGFINQVIKTGTYPGFANVQLGLGSPAFYHKAQFEFGGATSNRNFSYYVGLAGYNQEIRYADQFNGAGLDQYYGSSLNYIARGCGSPNATVGCYKNMAGPFGAEPIGPNGYTLGPFNAYSALDTSLINRDAIVNLHFGIPHKNGTKDDVQILYDNSFLQTVYPESFSDFTYAQNDVFNGTAHYGGPFNANAGTFFPNCGPNGYAGTACAGLAGTPNFYQDRTIFAGPIGAPLTAANVGMVNTYLNPFSIQSRAFGSQVPTTLRDVYNNRASILKAQYQKNFGSNAYLRLYGYTAYSDWLQNGVNGAIQNFVGGVSPDYELPTHTRGVALTFADQLNSRNLLNVTGGYTYASTTRWNNTWSSGPTNAALLVSSANPTSGICYDATFAPVYCGAKQVAAYKTPPAPFLPLAPSKGAPTLGTVGTNSCGGAPCEYFTVDSGVAGTYNTISPRFTNLALEDQFKPLERLQLNLGIHYDDFRYDLPQTGAAIGPLPTQGSALARSLYTNSYNLFHCFNPSQPQLGESAVTTPGNCASAGAGFVPVAFSNTSVPVNDYHVFEPRLGVTYSVNPLNVLRASYGKYDQPANASFQQYNVAQANIAAYDVPKFYALGYNDPAHTVRPEESYNLDFSWEHQIKGSDVSWKLTPFIRKTKDSLYNALLDPKTNFTSGINIGNLTAQGVEFLLRKGDFARNGLSGSLAYTFTYGTIKYDDLPNGQTVVDSLNSQIRTYNAYTSFCSTHRMDTRCSVGGTAPNDPSSSSGGAVVAAPCYDATGVPAACSAGTIANPYWNAPVQGLFDPGASYVAYNQLPGAGPGPGVASVGSSYIIPHVATLLLNYKHARFTVTPSLQFSAGGRYGLPNSNVGIDPGAGCGPLAAGTTAGDPRYPFGAAGGAPYDAQTCGAAITAPNSTTGRFDNFGQYREPSQLTGNLQLAYQASNKVTFTLTAANLLNRCFGGSKEPWTNLPTSPGTVGCWYNANSDATPVGNIYNPGNVIQPIGQNYVPFFSNVFQQGYGAQANPLQLFFSADIKV